MAQSGKCASVIARLLDLNDRTVHRIIAKHRENGAVQNAKRCGRPIKTSERFDRRMKITSMCGGFKTASKVLDEMCKGEEAPISFRTARRRLRLGGCLAAKKQLISSVNSKIRLTVAKDHTDWNVKNWSRVLWSDESKFNVLACFSRRRRHGFEKPIKMHARHTAGEMLWDACLQQMLKVAGTLKRTNTEQSVAEDLLLE